MGEGGKGGGRRERGEKGRNKGEERAKVWKRGEKGL